MPNVQMLLGNHEYMMLNALDTPYDSGNYKEEYQHFMHVKLWYHNGGRVTHEYLKYIRKYLRTEVFEYLRSLPINIDVDVNGQKFRLMHGGPVEYYNKFSWRYKNALECAVWHRWTEDDPDLDDCIGVFGHTPTEYFQVNNPVSIWYSNNEQKIGIDCGSGYPSDEVIVRRLACLRLDDMKEFYSEEPERGQKR